MQASDFYKFSKEQLNKAREVDLGKYLMDTDPNRFYEDEQGYIRDKQRPKFKVDRKRNKYFLNVEGSEHGIGNPIEYVDHIMGYGFVRAVETLLAYVNGSVKKMPAKEVYVDETNLHDDAAFAYYSKMAEDYVEYEDMYDEY